MPLLLLSSKRRGKPEYHATDQWNQQHFNNNPHELTKNKDTTSVDTASTKNTNDLNTYSLYFGKSYL